MLAKTVNKFSRAPSLISFFWPTERATGGFAQTSAEPDRMLVGIAAAVPWAFLKNPTIESRDVRGINDLSDAGFWDYSRTSLR
jgi:hypothetical protein